MIRFSYSRVGCFKSCPYQYCLRYIEKMKMLPNQDANNALYLGSALHKALELDTESAIKEYYSNYYCISDEHINEVIKLEELIPKCRKLLPVDGLHEIEIQTPSFVGYIDLLVPVKDGVFDLYDYKYSNAVDRNMQSPQLSIYKYYYEKTTGNKIRNMYFLFIPKVGIRQKKTENIYDFRKRLIQQLSEVEPFLKKVEYNENQVLEFKKDMLKIRTSTEFPKNISALCRFCEYESYCIKNQTIDILEGNYEST